MLDLHDAATRLIGRSEPPVPVSEIEHRSRKRRLRRRSALVAILVLVLVCSVSTIALLRNGSTDADSGVRIETSGGPSSTSTRLALTTIPHGVSARTIGSTSVFLVRDGRSVTTFLTDPHGTPGLKNLVVVPHRTGLRRACPRRVVRSVRNDPRRSCAARSRPPGHDDQQRNRDHQSSPRHSWPHRPRRRFGTMRTPASLWVVP